MSRFGGFGGDFLKEYHSICPKTEPAEEYDDRVMLYELYHHLNHHAMYVFDTLCDGSHLLTSRLAKVRWSLPLWSCQYDQDALEEVWWPDERRALRLIKHIPS
jgi:hypothetical protein